MQINFTHFERYLNERLCQADTCEKINILLTNVDYSKYVSLIATATGSVGTMKLPALLGEIPEGYDKYKTMFEQSSNLAQDWATSVNGKLERVQENQEESLNAALKYLKTALDVIQGIVGDGKPVTTGDIDTIKNSIKDVSQQIDGICDYMNEIKGLVTRYEKTFSDLDADMQACLDAIQAMNKCDQERVDSAKASIVSLQADITKQSLSIAGSVAAMGGTVFLGGSLMFGTGIVTPISWATGIAMAAIVLGSAGAIAMDAANIIADKQKIEGLTNEMNDLEKDITNINATGVRVKTFITGSDQVSNSLSAVVTEWTGLNTIISNIKSDIYSAISMLNPSQIKDVLAKINDALKELTNLISDCKTVYIKESRFSAYQPVVGDTKEYVEYQVNHSETYTLLQYIMRE